MHTPGRRWPARGVAVGQAPGECGVCVCLARQFENPGRGRGEHDTCSCRRAGRGPFAVGAQGPAAPGSPGAPLSRVRDGVLGRHAHVQTSRTRRLAVQAVDRLGDFPAQCAFLADPLP